MGKIEKTVSDLSPDFIYASEAQEWGNYKEEYQLMSSLGILGPVSLRYCSHIPSPKVIKFRQFRVKVNFSVNITGNYRIKEKIAI